MKYFAFIAKQILLLSFFAITCSSCGFYQYTILFKEDENFNNEAFKKAAAIAEQAEKNYVVRKFDFIGIEIFTNKGELLTDPNMEIQMGGNRQLDPTQINPNQPANFNQGAGILGQQGFIPGLNFNSVRRYMVQDDGNSYLPLLGATKLEGLKLYQVDSLLSKQYEKYYKESYVVSRLLNRRATVIGALGVRVVPLDNENLSIIELVATAGFNFDARVRGDRVRVIRNILTKPVMQIIDLSTLEGIKAANLKVEPNDIIYFEPRRRVGREETLSDVTRVLGTIATILGSVSSTVLAIIAIQRL
jgi:polysaccharide biosynthesis/export protein